MRMGIFATVLTVFLLFIGCGGGESTSQKADKRSYKVSLVDDFLEGATVKDSYGQVATYKGKGVYLFSKEPQGTISLEGGLFENTNIPNQMKMEIDATSKKLSPIASLFYKYPHLKDKILTALNAKEADYTINKNLALFRTSKIIYIMASNDLLDNFATSLQNVSNYEDIIQTARSVSKVSPRAGTIDTYLALITLSFFDIDSFSSLPNITDKAELLISSTYPKNNEIDIPINAIFNIAFNKNIQSSSVENQITLKKTNSGEIVEIDTKVNDNFISIKPDDLENNTKYTISISSKVKSKDNKNLKNPQNIDFTTSSIADTEKPKIDDIKPQNGKNIDYGEKVIIKFSKAINVATLNSGITITQITNLGVRNPITNLKFNSLDGNKKVIIENFLEGNSFYKYELNISSAIKDLAGNPLEKGENILFVVNADTASPEIVSISPEDETSLVDTNTDIIIKFNEPINKFSAYTNTTITRVKDGKTFTFAHSLNDQNTIMTIRPTNLTNNSKYQIKIGTNLADTSGNKLKSEKTSTFTTGTLDETPPQVAQATAIQTGTTALVSLSDTSKTFKAKGEPIKVTFNEAIDPSSIAGKNLVYIKDSTNNVVSIQNSCTTANCSTSGWLDSTGKIYTIGLELNDGSYTLVVDNKIKDLAGNSMGSDYTQTFIVKSTTTAFSLSMPLYNGATNIPINQSLDLNFNKLTAINVGQITLQDITNVTPVNHGFTLSPTFGSSAKNFKATPALPLKKGHKYKLTISKDITDTSGTKLDTADIVREFSTIPKTGVVRLLGEIGTIGSNTFVPIEASGTTKIRANSPKFRLEFTQPVNQGSFATNIKIGGVSLGAVPITTPSANTYQFSVSALVLGENQLTVSSTLKDEDNQDINATTTFKFEAL